MNGFQIRGVVEGFYGPPWTMEERALILREMARLEMNLYVYAPKNDLLHRHRWETPYPPEFIREFKALVDLGKTSGVGVALALSPGLTLTYSDFGQIDALVRKYLSFAAIGVSDFCLFLDDIPLSLQKEADRGTYASLAGAQLFFTNHVYERLKNLTAVTSFLFCPTQYCGNGQTPYLEEIGSGLHPDIDVLWTGPQVCSRTIPFEDAETVSRTLRRKVVYWDNYPVNDGSMACELHIGPYTGRDVRLPTVSRGFLINPMNQAMASIPVLTSIAAYLKDPATYDPLSAWESALDAFAPHCAQSLKFFAEMNLISPLNPKGEGMASDRWIDAYSSSARSGSIAQAASLLQQHALTLNEAVQTLKTTMPLAWLREVRPWLVEFESWGALLLKAAELAGMFPLFFQETLDRETLDKSANALADLKTRVSKTVDHQTVCAGSGIREFAMTMIAKIGALLRLRSWE